MKLTVPTMLTLLRIVLIPVLVVVFYLPYNVDQFRRGVRCSRSASLTDWLDGWIARRYDQYSAFGAFLDPVADKLMVAIALFLIVQGHPTRVDGAVGGGDRRPRDRGLGAARMDGRARPARAGGGGQRRQDQDHRADGRAAAACCIVRTAAPAAVGHADLPSSATGCWRSRRC